MTPTCLNCGWGRDAKAQPNVTTARRSAKREKRGKEQTKERARSGPCTSRRAAITCEPAALPGQPQRRGKSMGHVAWWAGSDFARRCAHMSRRVWGRKYGWVPNLFERPFRQSGARADQSAQLPEASWKEGPRRTSLMRWTLERPRDGPSASGSTAEPLDAPPPESTSKRGSVASEMAGGTEFHRNQREPCEA